MAAEQIKELLDVKIDQTIESDKEKKAIDALKNLDETGKKDFFERLKTGTIKVGDKYMMMKDIITTFNDQVQRNDVNKNFEGKTEKVLDTRVDGLIKDTNQNDLVYLITTINHLDNEANQIKETIKELTIAQLNILKTKIEGGADGNIDGLSIAESDIPFNTYGVSKGAIVKAANNFKSLNLKKKIIILLKKGNVKEAQKALGMTEYGTDLHHKADGLFGPKTLKNLEEGGIVDANEEVTIAPEVPVTDPVVAGNAGATSVEKSEGKNLTLTIQEYLEYSERSEEDLQKALGSIKKITIGNDIFTFMPFDVNQFKAISNITGNAEEPEEDETEDDETGETTEEKGTKTTYIYDNKEGWIEKGASNDKIFNNFGGIEEIKRYLDTEIKKNSINENFISKVINKNKEYIYGDMKIKKTKNNWVISPSSSCKYLNNKDLTKDFAVNNTIKLPTTTTLDECLRLATLINYVAAYFNEKETGTDNLDDIEATVRSNTIEDSNPFYIRNGTLYFSDAGTMDDYDIITSSNLARMAPGAKLEDLAKLFINRVKYKFDDDN